MPNITTPEIDTEARELKASLIDSLEALALFMPKVEEGYEGRRRASIGIERLTPSTYQPRH